MMTMEQRMIPIWDTDVVWGESLAMIREADGRAEASLLYPPKRILSVQNASETVLYEEGRDWIQEGEKLVLPMESRIFAFRPWELRLEKEDPEGSFPMPGGHLLFREGHFFHDRQIAVTYSCEKGGWTGVKPRFAGDRLPRTAAKLQSCDPLSLLVYGDSISEGANASAATGAPPYQPPYDELLQRELIRRTGAEVTLENVALGGRDSAWGAEMLEELVTCRSFDLLILAFGMNDGGRSPEEFAGYIRQIVTGTWAKHPQAEILLVATSTPNPVLTDPRARFWGNQMYFKEALEELCASLPRREGIAVADITGMQAFLHSRKRFLDTSGNNVNHPNDFFHRCYAQFLAGMLLPG